MTGTYRNRDYHQTRATRPMSEKRNKLIKESKFSFFSAVIDHYAFLMDLRKEELKLIEMAVMKACSDHYDDFNDNNLSNFVKTYVAGINTNI